MDALITGCLCLGAILFTFGRVLELSEPTMRYPRLWVSLVGIAGEAFGVILISAGMAHVVMAGGS